MLISLFVHLPLLPIVLVIGLLSRIDRAKEAAQYDYQANDATISVELFSPLPSQSRAGDEALETAQAAMVPSGSEGAGHDLVNEAAIDIGEISEAGEGEEAEEKEASLGEIEGEPNVMLSLWLGEMRDEKLAPTLRKLLACGKLGAALRRAQVEALDDLEAAVFAGPRLDDPRQYTAVLSHRLPRARLQMALSKLTWPRGKWLDEDAVRVRAAGATRVVFRRGEHLVLATPEPVWEKLKGSSRAMSLQSSRGRALSLMLREPTMALLRLGLKVPDTLSRMRLDIYPRAGGDIEIALRFDDRDEATARENAPKISAEIDGALRELRQAATLSRLFAPFTGRDFAFVPPRLHFAAEGSAILGRGKLSEAQVLTMLDKLSPFVCETGGVVDPARGRLPP